MDQVVCADWVKGNFTNIHVILDSEKIGEACTGRVKSSRVACCFGVLKSSNMNNTTYFTHIMHFFIIIICGFSNSLHDFYSSVELIKVVLCLHMF